MFANQYQKKNHSRKISKLQKKNKRIKHRGVGKVSSVRKKECEKCKRKNLPMDKGVCKECSEAFAEFKQPESTELTPRKQLFQDLHNIAALSTRDLEAIEHAYDVRLDPSSSNITLTGRGFNKWLLSVDGSTFFLYEDEESAKEEAIEDAALFIEDNPTAYKRFVMHHLSMNNEDILIKSAEEAEERYDWDVFSDDDLKHRFGKGWDETKSREQLIIDAKNDTHRIIKKELEEDPHQYYVQDNGFLTTEQLINEDWIKIDYQEAAKDAVEEQGIAPFLASFDGREVRTPDDWYVFRME
jgi:hypothetical protein